MLLLIGEGKYKLVLEDSGGLVHFLQNGKDFLISALFLTHVCVVVCKLILVINLISNLLLKFYWSYFI